MRDVHALTNTFQEKSSFIKQSRQTKTPINNENKKKHQSQETETCRKTDRIPN